jgi:FtsP/CotA-like multicopper oxidase with cupredoxin domain
MRRVLFWALAVVGLGLVALVALVATASVLYARADVSTVGELGFENELKIPALLEPRLDADGRKVFELELQAGTSELLSGKQTESWGAKGAYLGPTLRAARGDRVLLNVSNRLPDETTLHWHGMHLPARADGNPHQPIEAGETWSPSWEIDQPAATLWYHPHLLGATAEHVYRGIAGLFILDDAESDALPLPRTYGADDIPLIIQDKRFEDDGALDFSNRLISPTGFLGNVTLVNGTYDPYVEIHDRRVRFRLLNASNARVYNLGFADDRAFDVIASDAGLLEQPHRTSRLALSPGERAEIVAAFEPSEDIVLRSFEPELGTNFFDGRFAGGDDSFDLLQVRAAPTLSQSPPLPERLAAYEHLDERDTRTRRFELDGTSINDKDMDMARIDEVLDAGVTEIWRVRNAGGTPHNFHPHGVSFRLLDYAGSRPPAQLSGWKDTVYIPPGETVRLVVRSPNHTDSETPYMFHCHILQHEDRGMMGQFVVVER